jgi:hypothetical protein
MKRAAAVILILAFCATSAPPALGRSAEKPRDLRERIREQIVRVIRVIAFGDGLQPPKP